jgi:hypothetical protein
MTDSDLNRKNKPRDHGFVCFGVLGNNTALQVPVPGDDLFVSFEFIHTPQHSEKTPFISHLI